MRKKKERNQNNYDGNKFKAMNMENPKWEDMSKFDKKKTGSLVISRLLS